MKRCPLCHTTDELVAVRCRRDRCPFTVPVEPPRALTGLGRSGLVWYCLIGAGMWAAIAFAVWSLASQ